MLVSSILLADPLLRYLCQKILISFNRDYLVNYAECYNTGKIISSSIAESTVENLINKRCKSKQYMKWSRDGVHPLLQVRASIANNDWSCYRTDYVLKVTIQNMI